MKDMRSIQQWERAAAESLRRSEERRWEPYPFPHGKEWRLTFGLLALALIALVGIACLWAIL